MFGDDLPTYVTIPRMDYNVPSSRIVAPRNDMQCVYVGLIAIAVVYMLTRTGELESDKVDEVMALFKKYDLDGSNTIDIKDVELVEMRDGVRPLRGCLPKLCGC